MVNLKGNDRMSSNRREKRKTCTKCKQNFGLTASTESLSDSSSGSSIDVESDSSDRSLHIFSGCISESDSTFSVSCSEVSVPLVEAADSNLSESDDSSVKLENSLRKPLFELFFLVLYAICQQLEKFVGS